MKSPDGSMHGSGGSRPHGGRSPTGRTPRGEIEAPTTAFLVFVRAHARASEKGRILDAVRRGCEEDGVDVLSFDVVMTVTE